MTYFPYKIYRVKEIFVWQMLIERVHVATEMPDLCVDRHYLDIKHKLTQNAVDVNM